MIARMTKKTTHKILTKSVSPMKHIVGSERKMLLEETQVQAASIMRLNQMWGLEQKPEPVDIHKAEFSRTQLEIN